MDLNRLAALGCSWYFNKKSKKSPPDTKELSQQFQQSNLLKDSKTRRKQYGICLKCGETLTDYKYCQLCSSKEFQSKFKNWTSGNEYIDDFIQRSQLTAVNKQSYLLWIPYDDLIDIRYLANGGFTSVYSATWDHFETKEMVDVVLKRLHNGQISNPDFLKEQVSIFLYGAVNSSNIVRCYGFTKHPTEGYMLVLECAQDGDLRSFLRKQSSTLLWSDKLLILREIAKSLDSLHNHEFVHGDLHTLCFDSNPYGVIPYVAPEVFEKGYYTKKSDIYSFGIVMWELSTDQAPFFEYSNDKELVNDIRNNIRPEIDDKIPKCVVDLLQKCWDHDPINRPAAETIIGIIDEWIWILSATKIRLSRKSKDILNQFSSANNTTKKKVKRQSKLPLSLSRTPTLLRNNNNYSKSLSKYINLLDVEKSANASSFSSTESVNTITYQQQKECYL